jgi:hypothetical protein
VEFVDFIDLETPDALLAPAANPVVSDPFLRKQFADALNAENVFRVQSQCFCYHKLGKSNEKHRVFFNLISVRHPTRVDQSISYIGQSGFYKCVCRFIDSS